MRKIPHEIKTAAIVLAAGSGRRMGGEVRKQFLMLEGYPLLYYSLRAFEESSVEEIILVTGADDIEYCRDEIVNRYGFHKISAVIAGGEERYHSVYEGLKVLGGLNAGWISEEDGSAARRYVLIHDGARPFVDRQIIDRAIADAEAFEACAVGMPVKDTIKIADAEGFAKETPRRSLTWMIQTPQAFSYHLIRTAYEKLMSRKEYQEGVTDDAMVVESMTNIRVRLTEGSYENMKVTTPEDMEIAAAILNRRKH